MNSVRKTMARFEPLILLVVCLIHVQAVEKLSRVIPSPVGMPFQRVSSSSWVRNGKVFESPEVVAEIDRERRGSHRRKGSGGRTVSRTTTSNPNNSALLLAEKLAQDALGSKEMQDTIKELTSLNGDHKKHEEISMETERVLPRTSTTQSSKHTTKITTKNKGRNRQKGRPNRKHKIHKKRGRKHHQSRRRLKRNYSKKESSKTGRRRKNGGPVNRRRWIGLDGNRRSEKSVTCRRKRGDQIAGVGRRMGRVSRDQNSNDELPHLQSSHGNHKRILIPERSEGKGDILHRKRSHIVAQLMLTTTPDPNKKKPGDQGVEYSEYYNDNESILSPDLRVQSKMDEVAKTVMGGKVRSVRDTAEDSFLDQQYYDSSNDVEDDEERLKRNDETFVEVMEQPSNSMEYVDNTYRPLQMNGLVHNQKVSNHLSHYNYIPDQSLQRPSDQYRMLSNPSAEVAGFRQPTFEQFPPDALHIVDQNPLMIKSPPGKAPANIIPSVSMTNNMQSIAPGHAGFLDDIVLSQLPQPQLINGSLPYYAVSEMPLAQSTSSLSSPLGFSMLTSLGKPLKDLSDIRISVPDSKEPLKLYVATSSGVPSSRFSDRFSNPTPFYDSSAAENGFFMPETSAKATSVSLDSPDLFSSLREVKPKGDALGVSHFSDNDEEEDTRGLNQIEPIASRDTAVEGTAVKKGKKKGSAPRKMHVPSSTTVSEKKDAKEHGSSKSTKGVEYNLTSMTCKASVTTASSFPSQPVNTTVIANDTKAVASEILNEIIEEIEELRLENPKDEQKEGLPCRLTGSWVTAKAGVRIDMKVTNHSVQVSLDHLTSPVTTEGLLNVTWNVTGFAPFKRGGPFTLLATNNHTKTLAVFVGACKVCQGIDTIEGSWTVSREPRDCRDFQMSTSVFNEIFRRTRLYSAIKDKQSKHDTQGSNSTIATSLTSESTNTVHEVADRDTGIFRNRSFEFSGTK